MKLPLRKCYHAAKIGFFLIFVVTILTLFEHWRGGRRSTSAQTYDPEEQYEKEILEDEARIVPGLGEGGAAAYLFGEAKRLGEESEKKLAINVYLSDRIAYNRTLKDHRNPACERIVYDAELPSASVILIFHNEPYSVVVRTIWSVLNSARRDQPWYKKANFIDRETGKTMKLGYSNQNPNSPYIYLKEIILVDDNSTLPELKGKLSHYVRTRLPPDLVRILRLPDRVGLTRARLAGARYATGDVLIFLDAHCEAQQDWLRPLLQRIKESDHSVVVPIIDVVEASNFYYSVQDPATFQVGGFTFMGHFTWIDVPEREKKRRGSDISPTWSPTMAGGLFAINRAYYWELGAYDEQMAGWGGENLEMSFRIWQCGGTLETIPCSRVGHVFRSFHPYGLPAHTDTHGINTARMAEVWMDDYAELFYLHRPDLRKNPKIGDVTHRKILREKLKCKSFQWYLDNIYKEKFVPVRDVFGFGRFKNPSSGLCLDSLQREGEAAALGVYACHRRLEPTQHFALSKKGELRDEERCAEVQYARRTGEAEEDVERKVLMVTCHGKQRGQKWKYLASKQLQHVASGLCLQSARVPGADAVAVHCAHSHSHDHSHSHADALAQRWDIDYSELNDFRLTDDAEPNEQEIKLRKLRGQRRISRSLLEYSEPNSTHRRRSKHKHVSKKSKSTKNKHKRNKKNKFVLKLVRNSSRTNEEEHLEMDVYCQHHRLFPNNTFVRDLVTILNEKDIRVINNGRIFEHNKVMDLVKRDRPPTVPPTSSPMEPHELKSKKKRKSKKHNVTPTVDVVNNLNDADMADNEADMADSVNVADVAENADKENLMEPNKKIIIEEFVEMTTKVSTERPVKKRRKRVRHSTASPAPQTPLTNSPARDTASWDVSLEDTPLLSDTRVADTRGTDTDTDTWSAPMMRTHRNHSRKHAPRVHDDEESQPHQPVKLVMKSNLTLNFGDELFKWKRAAGHVANLLGELIIPANVSGTANEDTDTDKDKDTDRDKDSDMVIFSDTDENVDRDRYNVIHVQKETERGGFGDTEKDRGDLDGDQLNIKKEKYIHKVRTIKKRKDDDEVVKNERSVERDSNTKSENDGDKKENELRDDSSESSDDKSD